MYTIRVTFDPLPFPRLSLQRWHILRIPYVYYLFIVTSCVMKFANIAEKIHQLLTPGINFLCNIYIRNLQTRMVSKTVYYFVSFWRTSLFIKSWSLPCNFFFSFWIFLNLLPFFMAFVSLWAGFPQIIFKTRRKTRATWATSLTWENSSNH